MVIPVTWHDDKEILTVKRSKNAAQQLASHKWNLQLCWVCSRACCGSRDSVWYSWAGIRHNQTVSHIDKRSPDCTNWSRNKQPTLLMPPTGHRAFTILWAAGISFLCLTLCLLNSRESATNSYSLPGWRRSCGYRRGRWTRHRECRGRMGQKRTCRKSGMCDDCEELRIM